MEGVRRGGAVRGEDDAGMVAGDAGTGMVGGILVGEEEASLTRSVAVGLGRKGNEFDRGGGKDASLVGAAWIVR